MICEDTDFMYPMKADIYYPIINQNSYGQPTKDWVFDRTIACNATPIGKLREEDLKPEIFLQQEGKLIARTRNDPRVSSHENNNAITNIILTNIRTVQDEVIYRETAGPRSGKSTIFEFGTVEPFVDPFGQIDYYKIMLRRTENQSVGVWCEYL